MLIELLRSYGADWDFEHEHPLQALELGLGGASLNQLEGYREELRARTPSISEVEDAFNVALNPMEYERFLSKLDAFLAEHIRKVVDA